MVIVRIATASPQRHADELKRLYSLGDGHDVAAESKRLVSAATAAIEELQPYLIRHGIDDLSTKERKHFGTVTQGRWEIPTAPATQEDLTLLLRMDRLLQLTTNGTGDHDERYRHLAASDSPTDALGRPNPMSTASMRSPPTRRDTAGHHGTHEGRLRLGTPPTLSSIEKPPPVVGLRWVGCWAGSLWSTAFVAP